MLSFVLPEDPFVPNPDYSPEPPGDPTSPPVGEPGEPEPIIDPVPPGGPG